MAVEMNKSPSVRLTPTQEIKLAKPATELYVGQILKAVVVTPLTNNQVLININGQNLNAQSSHHFSPGETLEVKVVANKHNTVLEVQPKSLPLSVLQQALLLTLPKQAPPTNLLNILNQLAQLEDIPGSISQQINTILANIIPLSEVPQHLMLAISQSGLFFESLLLNRRIDKNTQQLKADFKGQCLKLLKNLPYYIKPDSGLMPHQEYKLLEQDPLPLPGAIPQPLHNTPFICLPEQSPEDLFSIVKQQLNHVLARITANQINHLSDNKNGYMIMLDLPIKIADRVDVIPLMIKQHKAEPMQQSKWSLSFALSLVPMGDLQATVSLFNDRVDIKINAQHPETVNTLNEYQQEIGKMLNELGLNLHQWKLQLGLENNQIDVANLRLLDIRI
ncbi:flagellar hook-length control protein FliK [Legionella fallonii]|uniref:Flagellar hook-length control protein-like C-terminal domain-containing protein n=1 Tax=Legionella fallonii LLAP-10 TaxID=1212491 RepID=A0A098G5Z7_9GAMM|nr:flagellar hook-length control protein FliK [Legionella fallonii]CEG57877.1 conserved protein of unknown function [Legionella fallonii LLAP-10]